LLKYLHQKGRRTVDWASMMTS